MNIMRKLRGSGGGGSFGSSSAQDEASNNPQHTALGLMHLKKLFSEYSHPQHPLSESERHSKLYNMLPLFCKVFGDCPTSDMIDKFRDVLAFCHQVSTLMVAEIRRRASNQSTEMASCSIVSFLEIGSSEEASNGWMLLSALNLLAAGDLKLVQVMTSLSVPSTLVKCLYLFFDLPEMKDPDTAEPGNEFTSRERRILLQKIFVQMLVRLCSHACPAEELARKDDLSLLFSAITSSCPSQNVMWRKSAAEVLMTISRHGLTKPVVNYIHNKGCVALCLENMQRAKELFPLEIVEMFVAVFCFLKDSSEVSQTLLDDFRTCQGYTFLSEFLLKLEQETRSESQEATRNLVLMLASLSTCGFKELKPSPASQGSLFQMGGFILPQPSGQGASVRNIAAFQVLQTAFLKSNCTGLCSSILDAISGVYHADNANYFILEDQNTLSQFAEKIHLKPKEIQDKFFQLLEFIVFQLNFVPCKELISLSILLKGQASVPCSITCMHTLLNILRHNIIFKDVYREVGILEVFVTCLTRYANLLKDKEQETQKNKDYALPEQEVELGMLVIEALTTLLAGNVNNANVFRECGGARCAHNLVPYADCRKQALGIVRELMMGAGGEDDMGTLLGMMHSAPQTALELKSHILKSLLLCLRESHRTRTAFRKVGGFVYVTTVLVSLEGRLGEHDPFWSGSIEEVLTLLHTVFNTLTVAMRFEPANAKFFYQEICTSSLCDSLRLLGCFTTQKSLQDCDETLIAKEENTFYNLFIGNVLEPSLPEQIPKSLSYACLVLRLLYDVALDVYDKPNATAIISFKSPSHRNRNSMEPQKSLESPSGTRRVNSLNLTPPPPDPVVVHPGVVLAIWRLLPSIHHSDHSPMALTLQLFAAEILKSLVRSERNQQVMCEAGLPGQLLQFGSVALEDETHPLHQPMQYMLERLAAQGLEPKDLRDFLRLGDPLCCLPLDDYHHGRSGGAVPLTRVKTIVSMTTPRDFRAHQTSLPPAFVEFDMSAEGFGGLYLPSIAPQGPSGGSAIVGATLNAAMDNNVTGGIGSGDRVFPPQTGLTYSTWLCVDKFCDPRTDPHPVRLLTLVRNLPDSHLICLTVLLSARDKAIIVSTYETPMPHNIGDWEPEGLGDCSARVWCPDLLQEGQWHHLALVLNRAVLKNSACSVYVDGQHIHTQKLHYISQNPGGGAANLTVASSVYGYIGTPPSWRRYSRLTWKQGPCHLLEDVLSAPTVALVHQLGPQYMGSLQAPPIQTGPGLEPCPALVTEDKVIFGLNAKAVSQLTLAKIRKVYNRADNRAVARQLGMSSHENATPIRVLHNSAGHLGGAARSLGGVVIGYLGVRVFSPRPVAKVADSVGGCAVLLGLIAMAQDVESLYAGVKALVCVVRSNRCAQLEMDRRRGYQTLAMLLRRKTPLLNSHILHLTFSLVGSVDSGRESSCVPNPQAFQDLLCDIEVWHQAPGELVKSLFEHLLELVSESSEKRTNLRLLRDLMLVPRLLHVLPAVMAGPPPTRAMLLTLLGVLLAGNPRPVDLLHFGQLVTATLSSPAIDEKILVLQEAVPVAVSWEQGPPPAAAENTLRDPVSCVLLRNRCLQMLHSLLFTAKGAVNQPICNEVVRVLGLDWALLWTQPNLHPSTVVWGLRILVAMCANPTLLQKFREGSVCGGWLQDTQHLQDRMGTLLGQQLGTSPGAQKSQEVRLDAVHVPGFQRLAWQLPHHLEVPEVYFLVMALMMGQPVKLLPADSKLDLDNVWNFLFGMPAGQSVNTLAGKVSLCPEAVTTLLTMVRAMLNQEGKSPESLPQWLCDYPVTIIQFLFFLYQNMLDFKPVFMTGEVLTALAGTLFPRGPGSEMSSCASSPVDEVFPPDDSPTKESLLTPHPARKFVMDFLRVIVVDSLSLPGSGKGPPVIDLVLSASPDSASSAQHTRYQTEILSLLMEHLLAADVLVGDQAALSIIFGGASNNVAPNVCYLAARVVDKLWQGNLSKDPHEVFDFVVKLISQAKRRPGGTSLEGLYHCLNRTILFLLSRATETLTQQMSVLEALHKLTTHRLLVFGSGNHELDFIGCLTYCLLQLTSDMKIMLDTNIKTTWHVNPQTDDSDDKLNTRQGHNLMVVAATRVWEELYVCKKPAIEEVFKITLNSPNNRAPELGLVRDQVFEAAHKVWLNYVDMERKATCKVPWELHNQIQSKIQKVTGGLTRLASRTKSKKEEPAKTKCLLSGSDIQSYTEQHVSLVKALVDVRRRDISQHMLHMQRIVYEEWLETETELTRERGLWGPPVGSRLDKWMLDMTEGPSRMRKKMMRNDLFYAQYPYRPELDSGDNKSLKYKVATSWDSKDYYHKYRPRGLIDHERDNMIEAQSNKDRDKDVEETDESSSNIDDASDIKGFQSIVRHSVSRSVSEPDDAADDGPDNTDADSGETPDQDSTSDNQTLIRLVEPQEKISFMFRCARIQGLDTMEGLLLFGKEHVYLVDGLTVLRTREVRDIDSLPPNLQEPILPSPGPGSPTRVRSMRHSYKFHYEDIREVHKRRYLLQPMALEVFSSDGRNQLLAFPRKIRNKVYHRFHANATGIADSAQQSVAGQKRTANVEQATGLLSNLIGETSVTQRWVRGEISNFQYLMHLNTLAGRSYNDLMQYPIFPWILADYDSPEVDFNDPASFRDFSKPMGAQSPKRLHQFKKRFKEWDDPHGETPPYHYGTHYSSAMIVCSYLVRMEPFTQHFLRLQGGHFDLADRMFNSIREAWISASSHNMADVKELIPEFFYLPEFLTNSNNFDLGCKQNGVQLGDVVLPPWAKEDPQEFIRVHRAALECDVVSSKLHHWIDLIFGYKQQGQAAVEATNVFHHLFYEGNVDIYNIDDPLKKNATIGFINNFGQIPKQLFKRPHPAKKLNGGPSTPGLSLSLRETPLACNQKLFFDQLDSLVPSQQPVKELKGPVGQILCIDKMLLAVEQNKVLVPPSYNKYLAWGFADHSLRVGHYDNDRTVLVCEATGESSGEVVACVCPSAKLVVTAGTCSVVAVWEYNRRQLRVKQCLYGHTAAVTCLAASPAYNVIVSGSRDCSAIVWDLSRLIFVRQLRGHGAPIAAVAINEITGDIATCAGTWLHVWTMNGIELASVDTAVGRADRADRMQQILCVAFSQLREWDSKNVIMTGSTDGVTRMWSLEYVQVPKDEKRPSIDSVASAEKNESECQEVSVKEDSPTEPVVEIVKRLSSVGLLVKSGSESSLSDSEDKQGKSKSKKEAENKDEEKEHCSDGADDGESSVSVSVPVTAPPPIVRVSSTSEMTSLAPSGSAPEMPPVRVRRRSSAARSMANAQYRKSDGCWLNADVSAAVAMEKSIDSLDPESALGGAAQRMRASKSDTSLTDSFVMVSGDGDADDDGADKEGGASRRSHTQSVLRDGFKWQRQLVFRSKLTMHTAYDRKDNTEPASITALAVSKDHRTVYVGDARGRVFTWSMAEQPGRGMADHWLRDEGAENCVGVGCNVRFSLYERRHHCRNCGQVFCSKCSRFESEISRLRILKPVRVCQGCHASLRGTNKNSAGNS